MLVLAVKGVLTVKQILYQTYPFRIRNQHIIDSKPNNKTRKFNCIVWSTQLRVPLEIRSIIHNKLNVIICFFYLTKWDILIRSAYA